MVNQVPAVNRHQLARSANVVISCFFTVAYFWFKIPLKTNFIHKWENMSLSPVWNERAIGISSVIAECVLTYAMLVTQICTVLDDFDISYLQLFSQLLYFNTKILNTRVYSSNVVCLFPTRELDCIAYILKKVQKTASCPLRVCFTLELLVITVKHKYYLSNIKSKFGITLRRKRWNVEEHIYRCDVL